MATITITDGDFGSGITVLVGENEMFLPDRARPGLTEMVALASVAEIESVADDYSGRLKEAGKLALRGASVLGPIGLAASVLAVRKVKDVKFSVRLADGRSFLATADAATYATIRASFVRSKATSSVEDARADAVIAKYLKERQEAAAATATAAPAPTAKDAEPAAVAAPPEPDPAPAIVAAKVAMPAGELPRTAERPVFGRRGR